MIYADKTKYIYELIESGNKNFFLSRPRRFGKTLLLCTIQELLTADRGLFKGLWIDQSDYAFPYHPVLYLSMQMESWTPQILSDNIVNKLRIIASNANLDVPTATPGTYFTSIIESLYQSSNAKVVVLIDEYDVPVTANMDDKGLARANATILHDFFATLKDPNVSDRIHFTLMTGITRYALSSMDSGLNHLLDISLNPHYAGICGFTMEEFDSLFANHMESTLSHLKEVGGMPPDSDSADLRSEIIKWYDGYNWGGQSRVLNPFAILNLFYNNEFGFYWIQSGRPGHLTDLIRRRPMDFICPSARPLLETELKNSSLDQLQAIPVLFHSGYLTLDTIIRNSTTDNGIAENIISYTFKIPNFEINYLYLTDCFCSFFNITPEGLAIWGAELKQAFLAKDSDAVTQQFQHYLFPNTYYQRIYNEKAFHIFVKSLLSSMGFKILSEINSSPPDFNILIELSDSLFVSIGLKYLQYTVDFNTKTKNKLLYLFSTRIFSFDELDAFICNSVTNKI
jgi:hypothetical protein